MRFTKAKAESKTTSRVMDAVFGERTGSMKAALALAVGSLHVIFLVVFYNYTQPVAEFLALISVVFAALVFGMRGCGLSSFLVGTVFLFAGDLSLQSSAVELVTLCFVGGSTSFLNYSIRKYLASHALLVKELQETRLREERLQVFKRAVETTPSPLLLCDLDGIVQYANAGAIELVGHTANSGVIGKPIEKFADKSSQQLFNSAILPSLLAHGKWSGEVTLRRTDGTLLYVQSVVSLMHDSDNNPQSLIFVSQDISDRKKIESALREREQQYRTVVENVKEVIFRTDANGLWTYLNPAWEEITHYSIRESIGQLFLNFVHPDDRELNAKRFAPLIEEKEDFCRHEIRYLTKKGGFRWIEVFARLTKDPEGNITGTAGTLMDITQRRHAEEELKKAKNDLKLRVIERTSELRRTVDRLNIELEERTKAEQALLASEKRISLHIQQTPLAVIEWDVDYKATSWNPAAAAIFGYSPEEALGQFASFIIPESERDLSRETFHERMANPKSYRGRYQNITKDGKRIVCEWVDTVLTNEVGSVIGMTSIAEDITERVNAENEIRKMSLAVEQSPASVLITDTRGNIEYVNSTFERISGYALEEVRGLNPRIMKSGLTPESEYQRLWEALQTGKAWKGIFLNRKKSGELLWESSQISPVRNELGIITNFVAVNEDITERKRAEERIREQAELLDKAHDAISVRDLDGTIRFWNKGAERMYGWTAEEIVDCDQHSLHCLDKQVTDEALRRAVERGEWSGELHRSHKNGKSIIAESRWTLVSDADGNPRSVLVIDTDITEKNQLQSQFLRAQRMESIGTLAGGIAHDLNNVLTPILMWTEVLREKLPDKESQKMLDLLETSAQRGSGMVRQVLSFSRGVSGERVEIQIAHIIKDLDKMMNESFPKSIEVSTSFPRELWTLMGDATQIHQVLMNLCVNARDAMLQGGRITITAENIILDENYARMHLDATPGAYIAVTVADTGSGIPPAVLDRIFEPFFTTKEVGKGTGLGLSTSLAIVKSHGGFINVQSEINRGTTFQVYLPSNTNSGNISQRNEQDGPMERGNGELLLIVDDEAIVCETAKSALQRYGYNIISANDGVEALALYLQHRDTVALVITDMMMPYMDGPATIRALQRINPAVKIIGASGLADNQKAIEARELHIHGFIKKPYTAKQLLKEISKVLQIGAEESAKSIA